LAEWDVVDAGLRRLVVAAHVRGYLPGRVYYWCVGGGWQIQTLMGWLLRSS
jgi:hypothetical protein